MKDLKRFTFYVKVIDDRRKKNIESFDLFAYLFNSNSLYLEHHTEMQLVPFLKSLV